MSAGAIDIDWTWWDAQYDTIEALHSGKYDLVVFRAGYGSGKTILGARWIIEQSLNVPGSDNLILAPDSKKGAPTTYKGFFKALPGEDTVPDQGGDPENSPIITDYNRNKSRLTTITGSVIRLGSADVWNRYAGAEFNAIWGDEVAHYENTDLYDLHEMLVTRQRTAGGPNVTLWTSTGNGYDQFYDITEREVEVTDTEEKPLIWADTMKVIVGNSLDNPWLNEKDKMLRTFEGTEREEQALRGGFAAPTGLVYSYFSRNSHVVDVDAIETVGRPIYGYDHGWKDPRVVPVLDQTPSGQYVVTDCYYETEQKLAHCKNWLAGKPRGTIYCEHEPEHVEEFKDLGFDARLAEKDLDQGIPFVRDEWVQPNAEGVPGLLVSEDCPAVIQEFLSYKEDHVGKSEAVDHALDAIRYALFTHEHGPTITRRTARGSKQNYLNK